MEIESDPATTVAGFSGFSTAIDTLVSHFNSQIDSLWRHVLDSRSKELSAIDENFRQLRDTLNQLIGEKREEEKTPRATSMNKGAQQK